MPAHGDHSDGACVGDERTDGARHRGGAIGDVRGGLGQAQRGGGALNYAIAFLVGLIVGGGAVFFAYLQGALPPR